MSAAAAPVAPKKLMAESRLGAQPDSVTEVLGLDHCCLDTVLAETKRRLFAGDLAGAATSFAAFREGLEHHIAVEEEVLFPALEALAGDTAAGPLRVMRLEHEEIQHLLAEVSACLDRDPGEGPTAPLAALTARVYAHNGKEERILYPMCDQAAGGASERDELIARMRAF